MAEKILVTGVNGFVGKHVAAQLYEASIEIIGVGNQPSLDEELGNIVATYYGCDLTSESEVAKLDLSEVDSIINLAGFAKVGDSKDQGELYNRVNVGVHTVLYEECLKQKVHPRIIAISTGAVYDPNQELPITEESLLVEDEKTNEYVTSKKLMEEAVTEFNNQGLRCIIARPFNHTGPGQLPGFLLPDLYEQIRLCAQSNSPLLVGNLDTRRDFTDVRDVAKAYIALATAGEDTLQHDVYNICSARSISGRTILGHLLRSMGQSEMPTKTDQTKIRENEVMDIYGSSERIKDDVSWMPSIGIEKTIEDFVLWQKSH